MILKYPIPFEGSKGEKTLYALYDSGATFSCIHPDHAEKLGTLEPLHKKLRISTASEGHYIEISHRVTLDFYVNDVRLSDEFMVVPALSEDAIIGAATLQKWRIKLDFEHYTVIVDPKVAKAILK
jgi:hypothetical protein